MPVFFVLKEVDVPTLNVPVGPDITYWATLLPDQVKTPFDVNPHSDVILVVIEKLEIEGVMAVTLVPVAVLVLVCPVSVLDSFGTETATVDPVL